LIHVYGHIVAYVQLVLIVSAMNASGAPPSTISIIRKTSSKSSVINEQEFPSPRLASPRPWKPLTFSSGILVPLAVCTAGLAAVLGIFQWQSSRNGALLFATTGDTLSSMENFLYRFCPTIIVVLYGMVWSWVDLDVKRLEPWFQLSQNGGSSARTSLLLRYPVDFLLFVPFKAAQCR
jgi:Protein of unknown function (DUF3433)